MMALKAMSVELEVEHVGSLLVVLQIRPTLSEQIKEGQLKDAKLLEKKRMIEEKGPSNFDLDEQDCLRFRRRLCVPNVQDLRLATRVLSLLAVEVTVFPNSGLYIGAKFSHVVADGRSFNNFMKFWASVNSAAAGVDKSMPFLDRNAIQEKDPCGLESVFLNDLWSSCASNSGDTKDQVQDILADKVRLTFVIGRADIERLKRGILNQCGSELPRVSTFVVACALVWTCLIKTQQFSLRASKKHHHHQDDEFYYFCFVADCRNRPELDIPAMYFGNCLAICSVRMMRSELVGEDGVLVATRAIGKRVQEFENGALRGAEKWLADWTEMSETGLLTVAGSPKLRAYGTDFGWGRPKKTEVVHVEYSGAIYIGDCSHEERAIEIGLALKRDEMEAFSGFFEQGLKAI